MGVVSSIASWLFTDARALGVKQFFDVKNFVDVKKIDVKKLFDEKHNFGAFHEKAAQVDPFRQFSFYVKQFDVKIFLTSNILTSKHF